MGSHPKYGDISSVVVRLTKNLRRHQAVRLIHRYHASHALTSRYTELTHSRAPRVFVIPRKSGFDHLVIVSSCSASSLCSALSWKIHYTCLIVKLCLVHRTNTATCRHFNVKLYKTMGGSLR